MNRRGSQFDPAVLRNIMPQARLESDLGVGIRIYRRDKDHEAGAYAQPGKGAIELSRQTYLRVLNMRRLASVGIPLTRRHAHAAFEVAHELGHMNASNHADEYAANIWAARNYRYVLSRMGLNKTQRTRMFNLARQQHLV